MYKTIPTYDYQTKQWSTSQFLTYEDFRVFVRSLFKDGGPDESYEFDETSFMFNDEWRKFQKNGLYCSHPFKSRDYINYWEGEKQKCREGVIYKNKGKTWYITRDYYMWLNFLPIYDKEEKSFGCPKVRDVQYHMALYELLAELFWLHCGILKKRQIASSYFHMAKIINQYYFEEGSVCKIGASLKDYISEKGSWRMLNEYRTFLNEHTAWYRPSEPDKIFSWQQRIKVRKNGRDTHVGNKSIITGTSFEKDPTNGVGGPCTYFFHEEAGIAPKMMDTYEFMRPALQSGMTTTGTFIAAGSVGNLDQCIPLKRMILDPKTYSIYPVVTTLLDEKGTRGATGLFLPEQWSMPPYIDKYGNSVIQTPTPEQADDIKAEWIRLGNDISLFDPSRGALQAIREERMEWEKELSPEQYQLRISQKPTNIAEAFASRSVSIFPPHLISHQKQRIEDKLYPVEYIDLSRVDNKIVVKKSNKSPITEFPVGKKTVDKTGTICVYERPMTNPEWGTYYASVDPVSEGKTTTSESLCSIFVYKNAIEVIKDEGDGNISSYIEGDKIVASWCGRFDDIKQTHERLELIIEWYNAWTVVENNVSLFIQYMMSKHKQKYLVPKDQLLFLKELGSNGAVYQAYGWKNTGTLFKSHLLSYAIEFLKEEIDMILDKNGQPTKTIFGVERIPDIMLLTEMGEYQHGLNVDRLVAFAALIAFVKVQASARGILKRVEITNDKLEKGQNFSNFNRERSPFKNIGGTGSSAIKTKRNPFKNLK